MGRILRHVLIFLLLILKEPNMSEADCKYSFITNGNLTHIPQNIGPVLTLSYCQITNIQSGAFSNLTKLTKLCLDNNLLTNIQAGTFSKLPKLTELLLNHNQIIDIQPGAFSNLQKLTKLILDSNQITNIQSGEFSHLPMLTKLSFVRNQITYIESGAFSNLPKLPCLILVSKITKIHPGAFSNLPSLFRVVLINNRIANIQNGTFSNLPNLYIVHLNINKITNIQSGAFSNLPKLEMLNLKDNQITDIQSGAFSNLPLLEMLDLDNNRITNIQTSVFSNLPKLRRLFLNSNKISVLPMSAYGLLASMSAVMIRKNPWQCDCKMAPFRLNMTGYHSFEHQIVCSQPARFYGKKLKDIKVTDLICEVTTVSTMPLQDQWESGKNTCSSNSPQTYHWYFKQNAGLTAHWPVGKTFTTSKPENNTSHKSDPNLPEPVFIASSVYGPTIGIALMIGTLFLTIWYYKRSTRIPPLSQPNVVSNDRRNLQANHIYYKRQQVALQTLPKAHESVDDHDHKYEDIDNQTGQGQSQAITGPNTNTTSSVVTSGHHHKYENMDIKHNQSGQGQSQAITNQDRLLDTTSAYTTEELALESNPVYKNNPIDHDQSQNNTDDEMMDTRNVIYATEPAASEAEPTSNPVYKCKNDQTGQDQSQEHSTLHEPRPVKTTANPKYESAGPGAEPAENKALVPENRNIRIHVRHDSQTHVEPPQLPSSHIKADPLSADSQPHLYEDVDSPQKSPKPLKNPAGLQNFDEIKSFGTADKNTATKDKPPPLPPRKDTNALSADSQLHLYEDVDSPQKSPKPLKEPGLKSFGTVDNDTSTKDEPPPLPPHKDTDPLSVDSQSHLYEDVDSPQKSPKPLKNPAGLKSFAKTKSFGTADKNIPTKNEPPELPPPRKKDAAALSDISQPHLYKDVDTPHNLQRPKPKDPDLKSFAKNKSFGTAVKTIPTKDEAKVPSKKPDDDDEEHHNYENHDLK